MRSTFERTGQLPEFPDEQEPAKREPCRPQPHVERPIEPLPKKTADIPAASNKATEKTTEKAEPKEPDEVLILEEELATVCAEGREKVCEWQSDKGESVLHAALRAKGSLEAKCRLMELLVRSGADVNATEPKQGRSPMHVAAETGQRLLIDILARSAFKPDADGKLPEELAPGSVKDYVKQIRERREKERAKDKARKERKAKNKAAKVQDEESTQEMRVVSKNRQHEETETEEEETVVDLATLVAQTIANIKSPPTPVKEDEKIVEGM
jgi:hypothetical protein